MEGKPLCQESHAGKGKGVEKELKGLILLVAIKNRYDRQVGKEGVKEVYLTEQRKIEVYVA